MGGFSFIPAGVAFLNSKVTLLTLMEAIIKRIGSVFLFLKLMFWSNIREYIRNIRSNDSPALECKTIQYNNIFYFSPPYV